MKEKPVIKPKFEPEVLEARRKRGDVLDLGRYQLTPSTTPPEPHKEKNGLAKVCFAIVSAVTAGAVIYAIGQNLSDSSPEPSGHYSNTLSVPIDMTPAPKGP